MFSPSPFIVTTLTSARLCAIAKSQAKHARGVNTQLTPNFFMSIDPTDLTDWEFSFDMELLHADPVVQSLLAIPPINDYHCEQCHEAQLYEHDEEAMCNQCVEHELREEANTQLQEQYSFKNFG